MQGYVDFFGLYAMAKLDADSLVGAIKDTLFRMNIKLTNCHGQSYDGASNMSRTMNGVATQIPREKN